MNTNKAEHLPAFSPLGVRLFLCGFLILFLELTLIRFLSGNIWNLGYFPNLVLLAAFVGLGTGFLAHERIKYSTGGAHWGFTAAPIFTAVLVLIVYLLRPGASWMDGGESAAITGTTLDNELFWSIANPVSNTTWSLFGVWFVMTAAIFALLAQFTAKTFRLFSPLTAYSLEIGGSLAGVGTFMVVSFLQIQATWWFLFAAVLWAGALYIGGGARTRMFVYGIISFLVIASQVWQYDQSHPKLKGSSSQWSPYQKISFYPTTRILYANNVNHQIMFSERALLRSYYNYVHLKRAHDKLPPYKRVMIIGAGSGNDVAAAMKNGAEFINAVEIDPTIWEYGKKYHPMKPYDSPLVSTTIDDGRHALFVEKGKYDLIIFALTDSLVKVSANSQLRLENYLFTTESLQRAWSLLNENGTLMLYNYYRREWLVEKLIDMLQTVSETPVSRSNQGLTILSATKDGTPLPKSEVRWELPTDDWPFLYLRERGVPYHYLYAIVSLAVMMVLILLIFGRDGNNTSSKNRKDHKDGLSKMRFRLAFMATGGAFLLLETKSVIQFSLLFGTTWFSAAIVFFGALSLILAANWTAKLFPSPRLGPIAFILLWVACLVVIVYPPSNLVEWESTTLRVVMACLLVFTPIYFANLVFAAIFRGRDEPEKYFGWNLLGGTIGGAAEYASMATGYHILAWIVPAIYIVGFVCIWPEMRRAFNLKTSSASSA